MLLRAFSKLGVCSRREAIRFIKAGRVQVNGKVVKQPTFWVDLDCDVIAFDGESVREKKKLLYLVLNKPAGYVTTHKDDLGRPTVFDLLPEEFTGQEPQAGDSSHAAWTHPVGRLDFDSEGLLLFMNDGPLSDALTNPEFHVPKIYRVLLNRLPEADDLDQLRRGISLGDYVTLPAAIEPEEQSLDSSQGGRAKWLRVTIHEGKNRQIRRMFTAVGSKVKRLIRIQIGPLTLDDLPQGQWRHLTESEISALRQAVKLE